MHRRSLPVRFTGPLNIDCLWTSY